MTLLVSLWMLGGAILSIAPPESTPTVATESTIKASDIDPAASSLLIYNVAVEPPVRHALRCKQGHTWEYTAPAGTSYKGFVVEIDGEEVEICLRCLAEKFSVVEESSERW